MPQPVDHTLRFIEQIGNEDYQTALSDAIRKQVERLRHVGTLAESQRVESHEDRPQVARSCTCRQHRRNRIVEGGQCYSIALPVHQIRKARREHRTVVQLGDTVRCVPHRRADVEQQMAIEVRLLLELLDVIPVAPGVDLPVDRREIVAGQVLPIFRELDAEALERAAMKTRQEPFDHRACLQLDAAEPRERSPGSRNRSSLRRAAASVMSYRQTAHRRGHRLEQTRRRCCRP